MLHVVGICMWWRRENKTLKKNNNMGYKIEWMNK